MISRSRSLPVLPSVQPSRKRLERSQSFNGAIHGASVQPSVPVAPPAPEQAVVVPQQRAVAFDLKRLPPELQRLVLAAIGKPHQTCTVKRLQEALKAFKEMSVVDKSIYQDVLPLLHATFLRLFGAGRIKDASFKDLPLPNLPQILESIVARSGLSGLQCLSDLVSGSLDEDPSLADKAFVHWIRLAGTAMATTALPYKVLPTLIAMRLGALMRRACVPPTHALTLMERLVRISTTEAMSPDVAMPALIEMFLVAEAKENASRDCYRAPPQLGRGMAWVQFRSGDVLAVIRELGVLSEGDQESLLAVAEVLATSQKSTGGPLTDATVSTALAFLADCPYPLIGCLAEALDIIRCMHLEHDPFLVDLLARCAAKQASARLLAVEADSDPGDMRIDPLAGVTVLVNGVPVTTSTLLAMGALKYLGPSPQ